MVLEKKPVFFRRKQSNPSQIETAEEAQSGDVVGVDHGGTGADTASGARTALGLDAASIKTLYEGNADTNAFEDADETKLDGIEPGAEANTASNVGTGGVGVFKQKTGSDLEFKNIGVAGGLTVADDVGTDRVNLSISTGGVGTVHVADNAVTNAKQGDMAQDTIKGRATAGAGDPEDLTASQVRTILNVEDGATADQTDAEIRAAVEAATDSNVFTDADHSKLDGIEAGATADQTAVDIRGLGFFDTSNDGTGSGLDADLLDGNHATAFATAAQGTTADSALQDVVDDTTPQLGGQLDVNGQAIGDGTRELVAFVEDGSAVNHLEVENEATGNGPILRSTGDDTNVDLHLATKGTGHIKVDAVTDHGDANVHFTEHDISGTAIDWTDSNKQKKDLTANTTFTFTAPPGPCNLVLMLIQDATGSRTVTWPAAVKWPGGTAPTLSTAANAEDIVTFYYNGTNYYGLSALAFS